MKVGDIRTTMIAHKMIQPTQTAFVPTYSRGSYLIKYMGYFQNSSEKFYKVKWCFFQQPYTRNCTIVMRLDCKFVQG
jgi:hypothetical protein